MAHTTKYAWLTMMKYGNSPLNLNLIIPFKDNKGLKKKLLLDDMGHYLADLINRVSDLNLTLDDRELSHLKLSVVHRNIRGVTKYYWRGTVGNSRLYKRLFDNETLSVIKMSNLNRHQIIILKGIEEELIYINQNITLIKKIEDLFNETEDLQTLLFKMPENTDLMK